MAKLIDAVFTHTKANACFLLQKPRRHLLRLAVTSREMFTFSSLLKSTFFAFTLICTLTSFTFGLTRLPNDEVEALKKVGKKLGKVWDFSVDPCSGHHGWNASADDTVTCNCSYSLNNTICHVVNIFLKGQSLQGTLPPELIQLPFLETFVVQSNYLEGTIPTEWGSMRRLQLLSLSANRLSGTIPKELGNLSTLTGFGVEDNQLSGVLPPELGKWRNLQKVVLNSNNFTGDLPLTLANLTSLRELWLSDNQFTGKIPDFIANWTNIERLVIQGSGLQGPIPSSIGALKHFYDLRISDLNGPGGPFPKVGNLSMTTLILRSCNLIGDLPDYLGHMTHLRILDVSFNKLTGKLPISLEHLAAEDTRKYLAGNLFTGRVPDWVLSTGKNIDLSYNNFTTEGLSCSIGSVNLFASSSKGNHSGVSCLANRPCRENLSSLYINCGGTEKDIENNRYYGDTDGASPVRFFSSDQYWGYGSTGDFLDGHGTHPYIWSSKSTLSMKNRELYMTARLSPLSLTYYGYCLMNGNYTVNLHFAEIVFTSDGNHTSIGRRIFDVYIQDKRMLKDFNIAQEARGIEKPIIKTFTVPVTDGTLEIRLYWAGKGTLNIPERGYYGPLISAISVVNPDFAPPQRPKGTELSSYATVGIIAAVAFVIFLILGTYYGRRCLRRRGTFQEDLKGTDLQVSSFTLEQIKNATNNFAAANKIGEGGFGPVYKGFLSDGTVVAVKQLSSSSKQGNREFLNEIGMMFALEHPHLVKLYGCCVEGNQLLLVYEYMENNSLAHALFGPGNLFNLDWSTRQRICLGIAKGLAYLHEESRLKIVHRDIKSTNVLLDKNLNPKISDFGLAKLTEEDNTHISTKIAGTYGYMAPEYAMKGYLTDKADVYSFGVVALEIVSGRRNIASQNRMECFILLDSARELKRKGAMLKLVDPRLGSNFKEKEVFTMINVALLCTEVSLASRPTMSSVVSMLEGRIAVPLSASIANISIEKSVPEHIELSEDASASEPMTKSMSTGDTITVSSTSTSNLYPSVLDSDFHMAHSK